MDKKGVLGLETAKAFLVLIMIVAIVVVAGVILLSELSDNSLADIQQARVHLVNTTTEADTVCGNSTGCYVDGTRNLDNCVLTITEANNNSELVIESANYTVTGCLITGVGASNYTSVWSIVGYYDYTDDSAIQDTTQNVTGGFNNFFDNTSSWFSLLAIVVIILIIAIVIVTVNRFGTGAGGLREAGGASGQL